MVRCLPGIPQADRSLTNLNNGITSSSSFLHFCDVEWMADGTWAATWPYGLSWSRARRSLPSIPPCLKQFLTVSWLVSCLTTPGFWADRILWEHLIQWGLDDRDGFRSTGQYVDTCFASQDEFQYPNAWERLKPDGLCRGVRYTAITCLRQTCKISFYIIPLIYYILQESLL